MYTILFTILLASTYVSAIPMPLGALYELQPDNDKERENKAAFTTSLEEAHRQVGKMQEVLKNPDDPRIKTAFGPNPNIDEISKVVNTLATKKLKVQSMDPNMADSQAGNRPVNGFVPMKDGAPQSARFGSTFFGSNTKQQAGTIIHEATHQLAGTGDHVDPTTKRIIPASESAPGHAEKNGGYSDSLDPPTASTLGSKYENMRDTVSNTYQNADSYRVFGALCSRSLYKRALLEDDPVGYYLSKRQQCTLPPDYFAKKAAAKAAALKGTTAAAKETTSPAAANRKDSTSKSTSVKGAKELTGTATKAAKGASTVRKGTSTRKVTGSMTGKGLKTVKSSKAAKSPKAAKGAKTAKGLKTAKAGKGLKAAKGAKAVKGVKAVKGAKTAKAAKAGVKVAKSVKSAKGAKGAKGTKSPKPVKAVKATKSPKSTAARKTTSVAKTATRASTKAATHASVKAAAPKAAVKVAAAVLKKGKILRRDLGMILDEVD